MRADLDLGGNGLQMAVKAALRRKSLTALVTVVAFSACMIAILLTKPRYTAESFVLMDSSLATGLSQPNMLSTESQRLRSEIEILEADGLARQVIRELRLWEEKEFQGEDSLLATIVSPLRSVVSELRSQLQEPTETAVGVSQDESFRSDPHHAEIESVLGLYRNSGAILSDGRSLAVRILFTAESPDLAARIANAHANAYLKNQVDRRAETKRRTAEWLESDLARRAEDMKSAETALQNFQPGSNLKAMEALAAGKRKIYETVLSRYDLAVSEEANTFPDAKIVSRAEPPIVPSSPKTALWLLVGFGLSTCLGIMSALVVEHRSGKSDTYKTAAKEAGVPILGVVPPQDSSPATKQLDMFLRDERIRDIRNQLLSPTGRCVTIAISSSLPGKHKSSIAVSLARSFRSAGLATLLIDADTVCPDVTEILGLKHVEAGFVDVIQRSAPPETAIQSVEGIYVLPCSRNEGRASPDFVSSQLAAVLERLQTKLDVIIIDAPPLLAASSALVVASVTDHTIVVTEQRKIPELRLCLELLQERDINVAGLVVIGTDKGQKHFFSKAALSPYVRNAPLPNASSEPTITSATSTRGDDQNELGALQGIETGGSNASVRRLPSKASLG